jgi:uncharacterized protein YxjI
MNLIVKQKFSLGFAKFEIYNENEELKFTAKGKFSFGGELVLSDAFGVEAGRVKGKAFSLFPTYEIYRGDCPVGIVRKLFSIFKPRYEIDYNGWFVEGSFSELEYRITNLIGEVVATVSRKAFSLTDTYRVNVAEERNVLDVLLLVLCIDEDRARNNAN